MKEPNPHPRGVNDLRAETPAELAALRTRIAAAELGSAVIGSTIDPRNVPDWVV